MTEKADKPHQEMSHLTMQVVDWQGPIVEISFNRPILTADDVHTVLEQAHSFMQLHLVGSGHDRVYFITCYDGFSVAREVTMLLQEGFLEFNRSYSQGDVRYGGSPAAKTIVISTAIKSTSRSEIYASREEALCRLRARQADGRHASGIPSSR
jgi:hypothetical protein